jgi:hypothetical protein
MPGAKKKSKGTMSAGGTKIINDALTFDSKLTRRLPIQECTIAVGKGPDGQMMLGLTMGNHPLGAVVRALLPGGPAKTAGLNCGDVISSIDGIKVTSCSSAAEIFKATVLPTLELSFYIATDAAGLLHKKRKASKHVVFDVSDSAHPRAGLSLAEHPLGLLVKSAHATAAKAGLKEGDVIVTLAGRAVLSPDLATAIFSQYASLAKSAPPICVTYYTSKAASLELILINSSFQTGGGGSAPDVDASGGALDVSLGNNNSAVMVGFADMAITGGPTVDEISRLDGISAVELPEMELTDEALTAEDPPDIADAGAMANMQVAAEAEAAAAAEAEAAAAEAEAVAALEAEAAAVLAATAEAELAAAGAAEEAPS